MKKIIFLLIIIPFVCLSQSGISLSGSSQFNIGESIIKTDDHFEPLNYEQRNNTITLSVFRGRRFRIGTIALKGYISYNTENTSYIPLNETNNYEVIKRSFVPNLEVLYILFQSEKAFLYSSIGSYAIIQNLTISEESNIAIEDLIYEYNSLVPFLRTGCQLNYGRFFINPFISFDLGQINFNKIDEIFQTDLKNKIENYTIRTGLEFGIMF